VSAPAAPPGPQPVRVKLYGLISITRRRYVAQIVVTGVMAFILLSLWVLRWPNVRDYLAASNTAATARLIVFGKAVPWILLGGAVLQTVEAIIVLRLFNRKEAEAQKPAVAPPPPPAPETPTDTKPVSPEQPGPT